jgi:hypothetical protein
LIVYGRLTLLEEELMITAAALEEGACKIIVRATSLFYIITCTLTRLEEMVETDTDG